MIAEPTKTVQEAARFVLEVQDACNLYAIVNHWLGHMRALRDTGITGDALNNHPTTLAFVSKLVSLARMDSEREGAAFHACYLLSKGEQTEYEVIAL